MKNDLTKYVERRKRTGTKFAANYVSGYREFKVGVLSCGRRASRRASHRNT